MKNFLYALSVQVISWAIAIALVNALWPSLLPNIGKVVLNAV